MTDIEILERANDYVGIHYVNGVEDAYISPCLLKAIKNGISALREQEERKNVWHDANVCLPKTSGLYYGKVDDTNSMYPCRYRDGIWTLDSYPEQQMNITEWADYGAFVQMEDSHEEREKVQSAFLAPMDSCKGLKRKFLVFKSDTGEMIDNCFVLRPDKDPAAVAALRAYAGATDNKTLADDIINWVSEDRNDPLGACMIDGI